MNSILNGMRPIHPGEILREEFLEPMGITEHALAMAMAIKCLRRAFTTLCVSAARCRLTLRFALPKT
jgi:plasmid maintenance system antidote protein VapI